MRYLETVASSHFTSVFLHQWYIQSTCATQGQGLLEGLDWLSAELAKSSSS